MTFDGLIHGEYDFKQIGDEIKSTYDNVAGNVNIEGLWSKVTEFLSSVPAIAVTGVLLALSLVVVFLGKRLLNFAKYVGFLAVGFCLGVTFLAPIVSEVLPIVPWWAVGLVVGVVAMLMSKMLYFLLYVGAAGYGAYLFSIRGYVLPEFTNGNLMIGLVVAAVAVAVVLICKKLIEMLGTAALGGFLVSLCVVEMLSQLDIALGSTVLTVIKLAILAILAIIGLVVQYRTRKRKW